MGLERGGYRPLETRPRGSPLAFLAIARAGLRPVLKRQVFRVLVIVSLVSFLFHSSIIYFQAQVVGRLGNRMPRGMQEGFLFTGSGEAYRNFIYFQNTVVMVMLALLGGLLVGGDFRARALPYYLSKPIGRLEYFLGKLAAAAGLAALITLLPALVLFLEYGAFTESFDYYFEHLHVLGAIIGYGTLVCVVSAVLLLGLSALLQRTVPIAIAWVGLFAFVPAAVEALRAVHRSLGEDAWMWSLLDFWANLAWVSNVFFDVTDPRTPAEHWPWAAAVLLGACLGSGLIFWKRVKAVEAVR